MEAWLSMGPLVQRYENLLPDGEGAIRGFCSYVGIEFLPDIARVASRAAGIAEGLNVVASVQEGAWDTRTLLHWDHFASPDGGEWREWTPEETDVARQELMTLMNRFGYEWTD